MGLRRRTARWLRAGFSARTEVELVGFGICPDAILPYGSWFLYEVRKHLTLFTMPGEGGVVMGRGSLRQPYFHCWKLSRMELLMR